MIINVSVQAEISDSEKKRIAIDALWDKVYELAGLGHDYDDAGCEWLTKTGHTYIAEEGWIVSSNPQVAALVDAINILQYGKKMELEN